MYHYVKQAKQDTNNDTVDTPKLHAIGITEYRSEYRSESVAKYHSVQRSKHGTNNDTVDTP